jgi:hypothetical protein
MEYTCKKCHDKGWYIIRGNNSKYCDCLAGEAELERERKKYQHYDYEGED